jgi:DNA-directed RNA polymerase subunit RPC12/RpoP
VTQSGPSAPDRASSGDAVSASAGAGEPFIRTFPCAGCGAKLSFAPGTRSLQCEFCGASNAFAQNDERIEELDFDTRLKALEGRQETVEAELVRCAKCGAEQKLSDNLFASQCSFCASPIVSKSYASRQVKPQAVVPFEVDRARAQEAFRKWVRGLWLAPGALKKYAQSDAALTGMYLPFWTYDCRTSSDYRGERGEHYYTTETQTTRNASGQPVTEAKRVQRTRWEPAAGHVEHFHDDVLVPASLSLPHSLRGATLAWNLKGLVPYQPEFMSGFRAEAYQLGLREGFPVAKETLDANVYTLVCRDIGGDAQRVHDVSTRYGDVTFKHVLLPVWISAYRFNDKTYRFLVNGQTGEVAGESPLSWQKVTFLVAGILILLLLGLVFGNIR